jgi:hypothetical protein
MIFFLSDFNCLCICELNLDLQPMARLLRRDEDVASGTSSPRDYQAYLHTWATARPPSALVSFAAAWPIVYCAGYNIHVFGLEKLHPFDACKWGNAYALLVEEGVCNPLVSGCGRPDACRCDGFVPTDTSRSLCSHNPAHLRCSTPVGRQQNL